MPHAVVWRRARGGLDISALPDRLGTEREVDGDEVEYRFANGLRIRTEVFNKPDPMRILPLGSPQCSLLNHLAAFPEAVRDARVFEPFAGSGALGLMALRLGAAHVDFLDVNPRAAEFHQRNVALSSLDPGRVGSITGDVAEFVPDERYDLVLANPPFVPTPDGIAGTLTSNGGREGSRFVEILADRLEVFLVPGGRALVYVFQLERAGRPLVADFLDERLAHRPVDLFRAQTEPIPFPVYCDAYRKLFAADTEAIDAWAGELERRHGDGLTLSHYVIDVGPAGEAPAPCRLRDDFAAVFGASFLAPGEVDELAFGRVFENYTVHLEPGS